MSNINERMREYEATEKPMAARIDTPSQYTAEPLLDCQVGGWQPIETAPDGNIVVVGWLDAEDNETPERYDFDYKEDGVWAKHEDLYQEFCAVAPPGSRGPREQAPYTHWLAVPPIPKAPNA